MSLITFLKHFEIGNDFSILAYTNKKSRLIPFSINILVLLFFLSILGYIIHMNFTYNTKISIKETYISFSEYNEKINPQYSKNFKIPYLNNLHLIIGLQDSEFSFLSKAKYDFTVTNSVLGTKIRTKQCTEYGIGYSETLCSESLNFSSDYSENNVSDNFNEIEISFSCVNNDSLCHFNNTYLFIGIENDSINTTSLKDIKEKYYNYSVKNIIRVPVNILIQREKYKLTTMLEFQQGLVEYDTGFLFQNIHSYRFIYLNNKETFMSELDSEKINNDNYSVDSKLNMSFNLIYNINTSTVKHIYRERIKLDDLFAKIAGILLFLNMILYLSLFWYNSVNTYIDIINENFNVSQIEKQLSEIHEHDIYLQNERLLLHEDSFDCSLDEDVDCNKEENFYIIYKNKDKANKYRLNIFDYINEQQYINDIKERNNRRRNFLSTNLISGNCLNKERLNDFENHYEDSLVNLSTENNNFNNELKSKNNNKYYSNVELSSNIKGNWKQEINKDSKFDHFNADNYVNQELSSKEKDNNDNIRYSKYNINDIILEEYFDDNYSSINLGKKDKDSNECNEDGNNGNRKNCYLNTGKEGIINNDDINYFQDKYSLDENSSHYKSEANNCDKDINKDSNIVNRVERLSDALSNYSGLSSEIRIVNNDKNKKFNNTSINYYNKNRKYRKNSIDSKNRNKDIYLSTNKHKIISKTYSNIKNNNNIYETVNKLSYTNKHDGKNSDINKDNNNVNKNSINDQERTGITNVKTKFTKLIRKKKLSLNLFSINNNDNNNDDKKIKETTNQDYPFYIKSLDSNANLISNKEIILKEQDKRCNSNNNNNNNNNNNDNDNDIKDSKDEYIYDYELVELNQIPIENVINDINHQHSFNEISNIKNNKENKYKNKCSSNTSKVKGKRRIKSKSCEKDSQIFFQKGINEKINIISNRKTQVESEKNNKEPDIRNKSSDDYIVNTNKNSIDTYTDSNSINSSLKHSNINQNPNNKSNRFNNNSFRTNKRNFINQEVYKPRQSLTLNFKNLDNRLNKKTFIEEILEEKSINDMKGINYMKTNLSSFNKKKRDVRIQELLNNYIQEKQSSSSSLNTSSSDNLDNADKRDKDNNKNKLKMSHTKLIQETLRETNTKFNLNLYDQIKIFFCPCFAQSRSCLFYYQAKKEIEERLKLGYHLKQQNFFEAMKNILLDKEHIELLSLNNKLKLKNESAFNNQLKQFDKIKKIKNQKLSNVEKLNIDELISNFNRNTNDNNDINDNNINNLDKQNDNNNKVESGRNANDLNSIKKKTRFVIEKQNDNNNKNKSESVYVNIKNQQIRRRQSIIKNKLIDAYLDNDTQSKEIDKKEENNLLNAINSGVNENLENNKITYLARNLSKRVSHERQDLVLLIDKLHKKTNKTKIDKKVLGYISAYNEIL